jgi:hypothetical protein
MKRMWIFYMNADSIICAVSVGLAPFVEILSVNRPLLNMLGNTTSPVCALDVMFSEVNDIAEADLIIAATNDNRVNQQIAASKPQHALLNMTSKAHTGDVVFPSILRSIIRGSND